MAKVSGENVERYAERVIADSEKAQINFAFDEIFSGLSLLEWIQGATLGDAWKKSLDKLRDFIFSIDEQNFVMDYLHMAVFEFRNKTLKIMSQSIHINEKMQHSAEQSEKLKQSAEEKIQNGLDILKNILSVPHSDRTKKENTNINDLVLQKTMERQREREYERERVKK